jgi:plastocyanin
MMRSSVLSGRALRALIAVVALLSLGVFAAACGSTNETDPTPVKTFKITPASGGQATNTPSGQATRTPSGQATGTPAGQASATTAASTATTEPDGGSNGGGGSTTLELVGLNTLFDKTKLEAPAGEITINFDNKDSGIPHNVHVHKGEKVSDPSVGATDLEAGPAKQTLKLTLEAGKFYYQCDAHPATMNGILTVN